MTASHKSLKIKLKGNSARTKGTKDTANKETLFSDFDYVN